MSRYMIDGHTPVGGPRGACWKVVDTYNNNIVIAECHGSDSAIRSLLVCETLNQHASGNFETDNCYQRLGKLMIPAPIDEDDEYVED